MSDKPFDRAAPERADSSAVRVYDTTLRDGTQREGISLSCRDKLRIAERLDAFRVSFVEGGWPGSNPKDAEFFERARDREWQHTLITAFASTRRAGIAPEDDLQLRALVDARAPVCTLFGKSSPLHVTEVLRTTLDENLAMIEQSVAYLRAQGRRVVYDAEHFFDGYAADAAYALATLEAAVRGGAEVVVLCDTNGGSVPWRVEEVVREVGRALRGHPLGIHAHDDAGCGVANSLAAVRAGARHVQGTVNGYGERCGNANLCAVLPALELKMGLHAVGPETLKGLGELSRFVAEVANLAADDHMPYVGRSAFAHKAGVHVSAMRRNAASYQHCDPEQVGNVSRVLVSELAGRGNLQSKAEEHGLRLAGGLEGEVLEAIKEAEGRGCSYEAAEASVALLLRRREPGYRPPFQVVDFEVVSGRRRSETYSEATVKLRVGPHTLHTVADGIGPVAALDAALRRALEPVFPRLRRIQLADYKVRILDSTDGTGATTRVLVDCTDETRTWSTVGASPNIIEASLQALLDGIEYGLTLAAGDAAAAEHAAAERASAALGFTGAAADEAAAAGARAEGA